MKYILTFLLIVMSISNVCAWGLEKPIQGNETFVLYKVCGGDTARTFHEIDISFMDKVIFGTKINSDDKIECTYDITICKYVYKESLQDYIKTDCCIIKEYTIDLYYNPTAKMYQIPDHLENEIETNGYLIKTYFQEMVNSGAIECIEFNATNNKKYPDVLEFNSNIEAGGLEINDTAYFSMDSDILKNMPSGLNIDIDDESEGEGIYKTIKIEGDTTGADSIFYNLFYMLIPFIFVILIFKFMKDLLKGD